MNEKTARDRNNEDKVCIGPLSKGGGKIIDSVDSGNMVAVVSGTEIMYVFLYRKQYQCFIHPMNSEEGRHKAFEPDERNRAMLKNLDSAADHLFEISFGPTMDFMGVMVAAERGIINLLDSIGQLPAEDLDFMSPYEAENGGNT